MKEKIKLFFSDREKKAQNQHVYAALHRLPFSTFWQGHYSYKPSDLLHESHYKSYRSVEIDNDEALNWGPHLREFLNKKSSVQETTSTIQTAVRKGIPDFLKRGVLMLAQNTYRFKEENPRYYTTQLHYTFGTNVPKHFNSRVPTFCGGFLGIEEDILNTPLHVDHLELDHGFNIHRSQVSWVDLHNASMKSMKEGRTNNFITPSSSMKGFEERAPSHNVDYRQYQNNKGEALVSSYPKTRCSLITETKDSDKQQPGIFKSSSKTPRLFLYTMKQKSETLFKKPCFCFFNKPSSDTYRLNSMNSSLNEKNSFPSQPSHIKTRLPNPVTNNVGKSDLRHDVYRVESVTYLHECLSHRGLTAVKRLLWCLNATFPEIEFCPILPSLLCVSLFYLSECDTFYLAACLLNAARKSCDDFNEIPILTYRRSGYVQFVKLVTEVAKKYMSRLIQHLNSLEMDVAAWIARNMAQGSLHFVSFDVLLRIYGTFFFEGSGVILRYCLAIFKVNESKLMRCNTKKEAEEVLLLTKTLCTAKDVNNLTKVAFCMSIKWNKGGLSRYSSYDIPTPFLVGVKVHRFYRPRLTETSNIISDAQWEYIWGCIPHSFRILDPYIAWRSQTNGMSLIALERYLLPYYNNPIIFLIGTGKEVIGGFFPVASVFYRSVQKRTDYSTCCLFQIAPQPNVYYWSGSNYAAVKVSEDALMIGLNDVAICLDASLYHARSKPSESFNSPQLAGNEGGDFLVDIMEVWTLH